MAERIGYDIIGDIHGHADELEALLWHLDYRKNAGAWRHPERTAVFVGDLIDGGPRQLETVDIVRRMVDGGHAKAVMGNHEFNAIAWHMRDEHGQPLRPHTDEKRRQHRAFLAAVADKPALHQEIVDWFLMLPLWLELKGINVVHACWHTGYMARHGDRLTAAHQLTRELMPEAARKPASDDETLFHAVEVWLKGLECTLPDGITFHDKNNKARSEVRVRWWNHEAILLPEAAVIDEHIRRNLPLIEISEAARFRYEPNRPVFFGHYWMTGEPRPQGPLAGCVDYSVAKNGKLVAYRWNGESVLSQHGFQHAGSAKAGTSPFESRGSC